MKRKLTFSQAINKSNRVRYIKQGGALRFEAFLLWLLNVKPGEMTHELHYYLSLLAFDGISLTYIDLATRQKPYFFNNEACISWLNKQGRWYRIPLSPMTIKLYRECDSFETEGFDKQILADIYSKIAGTKNTLENFANDQKEWFAMHLSGPLYEHISDAVPMASLPDSAYARLVGRESLLISEEFGDNSDKLLVQAITGYLEPIGQDRNPVLVDQLISACRRRLKVSDHIAKAEMLCDCLTISAVSAEHGPISSLILAWGISLIANGTRSQNSLSPATIANYVSAISLKLFLTLKCEDLQNFSDKDYVDAYQKIIDLVSDGQRKIAASAISSFHNFLEDWLDAPLIPRQKYQQDDDSVPKANIIWDHEVALILRWLDEATCDQRLIEFWQVAILIAHEQRIRIGELLDIRIKDIKSYSNQIEINISGQKTLAAKRTLFFKSELTKQAVLGILQRRVLDGALPDDFLFGDPRRPKRIYKLGQFYTGLNQLLKSVTGDRSVSFHTLSHTFISRELTKILEGGNAGTIDAFSQFSTNVGHYSILTTCREYSHLHHTALRTSFNRALKNISISSTVAESWSQDSAAAIRKRISVRNLDKQEHYWDTIFKAGLIDGGLIQGAALLHDTQPAVMPNILENKLSIKFETVFFALADLAIGKEIRCIASRQALEVDELALIIFKARDVVFRNQIINGIKYDASMPDTIMSIKKLTNVGIDFGHAHQDKYSEIFKYFLKLKAPKNLSLIKGLEGWLRSYTKSDFGYIALQEDAATLDMLVLLAEAGCDITKICVFVANQDFLPDGIKKLFHRTFSITPSNYSVVQRRGRPDHYLGVTKQRVFNGQYPHSSATGITGLNALLFAAAVWVEMMK